MSYNVFLTRFWSRVNKIPGGCWEWLGRLERSGYARIRRHRSRKRVLVHRYSYELKHGPVPVGLLVLHTCDNRKCVNPKHLYVGTHQDNYDDMFRRGRSNKAQGERHGNAKLSDHAALELLERYRAGGVTQSQLAKEYGLHPMYVFKLVNGHKRKHLHQG